MTVRIAFEIPTAEYRALAEIANRHGITVATLFRTLGNRAAAKAVNGQLPTRTKPVVRTIPAVPAGKTLARSNFTPDELAIIVEMHNEMHTQATIAHEMRCSISTISKTLPLLGLTAHPRGSRKAS